MKLQSKSIQLWNSATWIFYKCNTLGPILSNDMEFSTKHLIQMVLLQIVKRAINSCLKFNEAHNSCRLLVKFLYSTNLALNCFLRFTRIENSIVLQNKYFWYDFNWIATALMIITYSISSSVIVGIFAIVYSTNSDSLYHILLFLGCSLGQIKWNIRGENDGMFTEQRQFLFCVMVIFFFGRKIHSSNRKHISLAPVHIVVTKWKKFLMKIYIEMHLSTDEMQRVTIKSTQTDNSLQHCREKYIGCIFFS